MSQPDFDSDPSQDRVDGSGHPTSGLTPVVLVVDDEPDLCELLSITLKRMGVAADTAGDLTAARARLAERRYALCLTDLRLPDGDGLELVDWIQHQTPETPVAVITAHGSVDLAVSALKRGAFDFVSKPVDLQQLRAMVRQALKLQDPGMTQAIGAPRARPHPSAFGPLESLAAEPKGSIAVSPAASGVSAPPREVPPSTGSTRPSPRAVLDPPPALCDASSLIGDAPPMRALKARIAKVARSQAPVCILGESGSGKERVAREIHRLGPRRRGAFVAVNCGAIPAELMESEFFGHRKGAFSGALRDHEGLFRAADGGTLFLDEVADLPLPMQVKLLRALQERAVKPVGALREEAVDVRILSATHKDLAHEVAAGRFRQDLYYRLNVIELRVPALRERREDIPRLAHALLARIHARNGDPNGPSTEHPAPILTPAALDALCHYPFPGNVRELENILERAAALAEHGIIDVADLALAPPERAVHQPIVATTAPPSSDGLRADETPTPADAPAAAASNVEPPPPPPPSVGLAARERRVPSAIANPHINLDEQLAEQERATIEMALARTGGNRTAAARLLGLSFRQLRYRLKKLGME